jgi:hypothetical protein
MSEEFGAQPPAEGTLAEGTPGATPPENDPGQGGTPPATDTPGQEPSATPGAEPGEDQDFIEKDGVKYYRAFDKHPDWRSLKDSQNELSEILEDNGYASLSELVSDLKAGMSVTELLGTADANKVQALLDKSSKWDAAEEFWAEEEARKKEKGESDEDTIARLKNEKRELLNAQKTDKQKREEQAVKQGHLDRYDADVSSLVDETDLADAEKSILKLHLGVSNPMDDIDIADRKAVRATAREQISQFSEFVKGIRQAAIDEYSKGKSDLTPTPQPAGDQTPSVQEGKVKVDSNTSVEEAFGEANKIMVEAAEAMVKAQG